MYVCMSVCTCTFVCIAEKNTLSLIHAILLIILLLHTAAAAAASVCGFFTFRNASAHNHNFYLCYRAMCSCFPSNSFSLLFFCLVGFFFVLFLFIFIVAVVVGSSAHMIVSSRISASFRVFFLHPSRSFVNKFVNVRML